MCGHTQARFPGERGGEGKQKGGGEKIGEGAGERTERSGDCACLVDVQSAPPAPLKWPPTSAGGGPCAHGAVTEIYSAHSEVSLSLPRHDHLLPVRACLAHPDFALP